MLTVLILYTPTKYQDFSSDNNFVSSQVKIQFLSFTCEDIMVVMATSDSANRKRTSQHCSRLAFFHKSFALTTKSVGCLLVEMQFSKQVPNFDLSFLDEEQNERIKD